MLELETFLWPVANLGYLIIVRIVTKFPNFSFCLQPCSFVLHSRILVSREQEQIHRSTLRIVLAKWRIAIALGARAQFMMRRLEVARVRPLPCPACVFASLLSVLCPSAFCPLLSALCRLSSALCPLPPSPLSSVFCPLPSALCLRLPIS